jgi:uroporphyrinogen III methyltransferase/synthase
MNATDKKGKVYLVGAGPGRVDLITVRGLELLKAADCIVCDKLANPALVKYAGKDAEVIAVPKRVGAGSFTQEQINQLLIAKAREGKMVVRLKGGDPLIFGRGTQEAIALAEADIDFEIVPGVTAGIAAGAYAGIAVTDRRFASQVVFVTGKEAEGKAETNIDWDLLARFRGTIVFYMGMENLDFIIRRLLEKGLSDETPVAVIADATLPAQRAVTGSLKSIVERCAQEKIEPPAIIVIGPAGKTDPRLNWFTKLPLFGKTIVVTRDEKGNADFAAKVVAMGGNPIEFPAIKIKPLTDRNEFLQALAKIREYDWLIFTSANGVAFFFEAIGSMGKDARVFGSAKIAAIGSETAARLAQFGIKADFIPREFTSEQLARGLTDFTPLKERKVLLLRSEVASDELIQLLTAAGAAVDNVPVYAVEKNLADCSALRRMLAEKQIHWLTFGSPSSVKSFFEQIDAELVKSSNARIASIGPVTSRQLQSLGVKVNVEPVEHTIDGLLAAIEEACR